jgi:hypothetical protein
LILGELNGAYILCSETCALDIIGARFVREVENGEVIVISEDGVESLRPFPRMQARPCVFEYVYFSRPDSILGGRSVYEVRKQFGRQLAQEAPADVDVIIPVPDSGRTRRARLFAGLRCSLRARHHPQPLCRPYLHRADPDHPGARRQAQAQCQSLGDQRQARASRRRLDRARHHLGQDRAHDV